MGRQGYRISVRRESDRARAGVESRSRGHRTGLAPMGGRRRRLVRRGPRRGSLHALNAAEGIIVSADRRRSYEDVAAENAELQAMVETLWAQIVELTARPGQKGGPTTSSLRPTSRRLWRDHPHHRRHSPRRRHNQAMRPATVNAATRITCGSNRREYSARVLSELDLRRADRAGPQACHALVQSVNKMLMAIPTVAYAQRRRNARVCTLPRVTPQPLTCLDGSRNFSRLRFHAVRLSGDRGQCTDVSQSRQRFR